MANPISEQTKSAALKIAKGIQKPGQTKEQTKLISQGIEKGVAEYKKQQKNKARDADKERKKILKAKLKASDDVNEIKPDLKQGRPWGIYLPWVLLAISWTGILSYYSMSH